MSYVAQDKEMLHAYQMREMALSDFTSGMNHARREGIAIGEQRGEQRGITIGEQRGITIGEQRGIAKIVVSLRNTGLPVEDIAKHTQLPMEQVAAILKEQGLT
jgi:predicted transposase YdaD